jgi:hypothetical protein
MPYTERRTYENGRTMRIEHDRNGIWRVSGDGQTHPHAGPGWSRDRARWLADSLAQSQSSGDWVPAAAPGDTVPCVYDGCHGVMTFAVGPDPTRAAIGVSANAEALFGTSDADHTCNVRILA